MNWPKGFLVMLICVSFHINLNAQNFQWAKALGGSQDEKAVSVTTDIYGNVYTLGMFQGNVDFDASASVAQLSSLNHFDLFITKYDGNGNFVWVKQIMGNQNISGKQIRCDFTGALYLTGEFQGLMDCNPNAGVSNLISLTSNLHEIFIIKLNINGNFLWAKQFKGNDEEEVTSMELDQNGNIYLAGTYKDSLDVDPGTANIYYTAYGGHQESFILKLSAFGTYIFSKNFQCDTTNLGTQANRIQSLQVSTSGNIFLHGSFMGKVDFDPGQGQYWISQLGLAEFIFQAKLGASGQFLWANAYGGNSNMLTSKAIVIDSSENMYAIGDFQGAIDFDPSVNAYMMISPYPYLNDVFITKFNSQGQFIWAKQVGGIETDAAKSICIDKNRFIYVNGSFKQTVNLNPNGGSNWVTSNGMQDGFMLTLDANGNFHGAGQIGGVGDDQPEAIVHDGQGNFYTVGEFQQSADLNQEAAMFNVTSNGGQDFFIHKMSRCLPSVKHVYVSGCTANVNTIMYNNTGVYTQYYTAANGCDSVLFVHFNSLQSQASINLSSCDTLSYQGFFLDTSGSYTQQYINAQGCDSFFTAHFTRLLGTDSTLLFSGCDSLTINGETYFNSGLYQQHYINSLGCDSTLNLDLYIPHSSVGYLSYSACDSAVINSVVYANSGTYYQQMPNVQGCDSLLQIDLVIHSSFASSVADTACDHYIWNGQTYSSSGTYTQVYQTQFGCDSLMELQLVIKSSTQTTIIQTACDTFELNGITYTDGGAYQQNFMNAVGCDSVVHLNLTIIKVSDSVVVNGPSLKAYANGALYQWLKCPFMTPIANASQQVFWPSVNGYYALAIEQFGCKDTSKCFTVNSVGLEPKFQNEISIYPIPANDQLFIRSELNLNELQVDLYSIAGESLKIDSYQSGNQLVIPVKAYSSGVYFLRFNYHGETSWVKWVKE